MARSAAAAAARDPTQLLLHRAECSMCLRYWNYPVAVVCASCRKKRRYPICKACLDRCWKDKSSGFLCPACSQQKLQYQPRGRYPGGAPALCEMHGKGQNPATEGQVAAFCTVCREKALMVYAAAKRTLNILKNATFQKPEEIMKNFKVPVTLDPDTIFYRLTMYEDGKRVVCTGGVEPLPPDNPKRFTVSPCVLGKEGFSSGRHYWEVQILEEDGGGWSVGVARETVTRKEYVDEEPESGVWAVGFNGDYVARTSFFAPIYVQLREWPKKLGVYMDYEEGWLSVYNADTLEHFYTFTCVDFTGWGRIFPYFNLMWGGTDLRLV